MPTILERELWQHATGLSGLHGSDDDGLDGLFSKLFKAAGPILPIAGAALAPFTGGASLVAAGALTAVGNAVTAGQAPGAPALVAPPPTSAPAALPQTILTPVPAAAGGMSQSTLIALGVGALVLVLLLKKR